MHVGITPAHAGSTRRACGRRRRWSDHPRSRGEHVGTEDVVGSEGGITPAHAGSTSSRPRAASRRRDHPRSRGEHSEAERPSAIHVGSPPLTRGARRRPGMALQHELDHPRSRGEHPALRRSCSGTTGSPPLTRGARRAHHRHRRRRRITPAHAGSTCRSRPRRRSRADHPRSRGEHPLVVSIHSVETGSPPLTRGALVVDEHLLDAGRITPAHAGSTSRSRCRATWLPDHPRSRGEHRPESAPAACEPGSPPLTRGVREGRDLRAGRERITPAHAGSTRARTVPATTSGDHPRSRGEHVGTSRLDPR